eukprot:6202660-Pleurochrysis_carterae.AAC.5
MRAIRLWDGFASRTFYILLELKFCPVGCAWFVERWYLCIQCSFVDVHTTARCKACRQHLKSIFIVDHRDSTRPRRDAPVKAWPRIVAVSVDTAGGKLSHRAGVVRLPSLHVSANVYVSSVMYCHKHLLFFSIFICVSSCITASLQLLNYNLVQLILIV